MQCRQRQAATTGVADQAQARGVLTQGKQFAIHRRAVVQGSGPGMLRCQTIVHQKNPRRQLTGNDFRIKQVGIEITGHEGTAVAEQQGAPLFAPFRGTDPGHRHAAQTAPADLGVGRRRRTVKRRHALAHPVVVIAGAGKIRGHRRNQRPQSLTAAFPLLNTHPGPPRCR